MRLAALSEHPLPSACAIDASTSGVLVALCEPFGMPVATRVCLSVANDDGFLHLMGRVRRSERGTDYRTYVAVALDEPAVDTEREAWIAWIRACASVDVASVDAWPTVA